MPPKIKRQPSIRDLARELSLSVSTVSKALNGYNDIPEATHRRVKAAADAMGYLPNRTAQKLTQGRSRLIGVLLPTFHNPFYLECLGPINHLAVEHGVDLQIVSSEWDPAAECALCREFLARRAEVVICVGSTAVAEHHDHLQALLQHGVKLLGVAYSNPHPFEGIVRFDPHHRHGMAELARHMLALGHRKPLLIGPWDQTSGHLEGLGDALREAGLPEDDFLLPDQPRPIDKLALNRSMPRWGHELVSQHLDGGQSTPTWIAARNDLMAIGAMAALRERGLRVPQDVSVTGYDGIEMSRYTHPTLTTVSQVEVLPGQAAFMAAVSWLKHKQPQELRSQTLEPHVLLRDSTGPARPTPSSDTPGRPSP